MEKKILNTKQFVGVCLGLLRRTSEIIRDVQFSGIQSEWKKIDDPVTQADFQSQYIILNGLRQHWPSLNIIGEEVDKKLIPTEFDFANVQTLTSISQLNDFDREFNLEDLVVYVDPLDGTKSFVEGRLSDVTTLVGLAYKSEPLLGIIAQQWPESKDQFAPVLYVGMIGAPNVHAIRLKGVNDYEFVKSIGQFSKIPADHKMLVACSINHYEETVEAFLAHFGDFQRSRCSGMGHKYLELVEGRIDAFLNNLSGSGRWDTLAGSALVEALGGEATDIFGVQYPYDGDRTNVFNNRGYFIIRDKAKHSELISKFKATHAEATK